MISAFVRSPTFGGASDLAHLSLLSGIDLSDPLRHHLLLASDRPTLIQHFRACGYETYGFYPALSWEWPERSFYGYDHFLEARGLDYRGPKFGYWKIPDQYAIARFHDLYPVRPDSPPRFVFFATINTHAPFRPLPPYQPDWAKLLSSAPYPLRDVERALAERIDWSDLRAPYVRSIDPDQPEALQGEVAAGPAQLLAGDVAPGIEPSLEVLDRGLHAGIAPDPPSSAYREAPGHAVSRRSGSACTPRTGTVWKRRIGSCSMATGTERRASRQ